VDAKSTMGRLALWDVALLRMARTYGHTPGAEQAVRTFSRSGEHAGVWLALGTAGALIDRPRRRRWRRARAAVARTYVINTAIKFTVRRRRPQIEGLPALTRTPSPLSLPSAHTATAVAGTIVYSRLGVPASAHMGPAGALAYSRLYLGVHYPSDVLAGAVLGAAMGMRAARGLGDSDRPLSAP
jgi:membrane-associated phospholipid phosphatase